MTKEEKRQELLQKVKEAEARIDARSLSDRARAAGEDATAFISRHPLASIAGGIAVGMLIGSLIPGRKIGNRGRAMAAMAAEFGMAYAREAFEMASDAAQSGQDKLEDIGDAVTDKSRKLRRDATHAAGTAADTARSLGRRAGRQAGRAVRDLRNRTTH
ncbi:MAG: hypothetical protein R3E18_09275 [Sphingomonadaceae bacterium]|nr:hypothetical protein [Sphingomonadaceae bacterium]